MRSYLLKQPSFPRIAAATELALPVNAGGYTVILEYRTRSLFEEFSKCTVPVTVYSTYCRAIQLQYKILFINTIRQHLCLSPSLVMEG